MDMNLSTLITSKLIKLDLAAKGKREVLSEMVELLYDAGKVKEKDTYLESVVNRENLGSTGIGMGIAIPHGKSDAITDVVIGFGRSKEGINFEALDDNPVHLVFLLAAPKNVGGIYLKALAQLSRLLRTQEFRQRLMDAGTQEEILSILTTEPKQENLTSKTVS